MKLLFKQRLFSWFDSYDIYDQNNETVFTVEGKMSFGRKLQILDKYRNHIGTVKQVMLTFLPKFELYIKDEHIGSVSKTFSFFKPKYVINCNGWVVEGNILGWNYEINSPKGKIATVSKELFHLTDTYVIDVVNDEDNLMALMSVLAIDAEKASRN